MPPRSGSIDDLQEQVDRLAGRGRGACATRSGSRDADCRRAGLRCRSRYGGAEIFSDTLVDELRARGHEAEIVSVPFKWYPGTQRADAGVHCGGCST